MPDSNYTERLGQRRHRCRRPNQYLVVPGGIIDPSVHRAHLAPERRLIPCPRILQVVHTAVQGARSLAIECCKSSMRRSSASCCVRSSSWIGTSFRTVFELQPRIVANNQDVAAESASPTRDARSRPETPPPQRNSVASAPPSGCERNPAPR